MNRQELRANMAAVILGGAWSHMGRIVGGWPNRQERAGDALADADAILAKVEEQGPLDVFVRIDANELTDALAKIENQVEIIKAQAEELDVLRTTLRQAGLSAGAML